MNDRALAALFVVALWWMSTCVVLGIVWLRRATFRYSLVISSLLGLGGLYGAWWSSRFETSAAAYLSFGCALAVWGWHEVMFLLGVITGPRKEALPPGTRGWRRFVMATAAVLHHELALAVTLVLIAALTWGQPNQIGTWTFLVLWAMRLSAKLNVFLGVRNLSQDFIPAHLRYLLSYFRRARMNALMPVTIALATTVTVRLAMASMAADASGFVVVGRALVATILALAVLEHLFLALPVPDAVLWRWAIRTKIGPTPDDVPAPARGPL